MPLIDEALRLEAREVAKRLRLLASSSSERLSDYERVNHFVKAGTRAADLLGKLSDK
jgi:hypothetical protein